MNGENITVGRVPLVFSLCIIAIIQHLDFNPAQTCCGQPAFNSGYHDEARRVALHFLDVFQGAEYIVVPSGSATRASTPALAIVKSRYFEATVSEFAVSLTFRWIASALTAGSRKSA